MDWFLPKLKNKFIKVRNNHSLLQVETLRVYCVSGRLKLEKNGSVIISLPVLRHKTADRTFFLLC